MDTFMNVCLIGGNGLIGSALGENLVADGHKVSVLGRHEPTNPNPNIHYVTGDYGDPQALKCLKGIDEVVLLAYSSVPGTSFQDPLADVTNNLPRVLEFLKAATEYELKKVVLISSGGACYGKTEHTPISETHTTDPISPYGISKLAIEKYGLMYRELYGLPVVIVRPGNAYGPGQKPFTGQGFVATAIGSVLNDEPIKVFGPSGTVRDYLYITDMAAGIKAVMEHGTLGSIYNLGSGIGTSTLEMTEQLRRISGKDIVLELEPARSFDVPFIVLNSEKITAETGWKPTVSLDEGLRITLDWQVSTQAL